MTKRNVRRPTEDLAIAKVMREKNSQGDPTLLQRIVMGKDGTKYRVWFFHSTINVSISQLWDQWQSDWRSMKFVEFLSHRGIIYNYRKAS